MESELVQNVTLFAVTVISVFAAAWKYFKTEFKKDDEKASAHATNIAHVTAATFLDAKILHELIEAIKSGGEEYARENRKLYRSRQELVTALEEATDAMLANTDASVNLLRFLRRAEFSRGENHSEG